MGYQVAAILENLRTWLMYGLDIAIIWFLFYYLLKVVKNNSRTSQIFKGIIVIILVNALSKLFGLKTVSWLSDMFINYGILAIIIVFQPEIRSMLERLGKSNVFSRMSSLSGNEKNKVVDTLVQAVGLLSQNQVGALITIEQSQSLYEYIEKATPIGGKVTAELLTSLFVTSTPLHDGAVIIEGDTIACAGAYFPTSSLDLPNKYGARHRAAIGISEVSDAVSIIVSEETGRISITENGRIYTVNRAQLKDYLLRVICGDETQSSTFVSSVNQPVKETVSTTTSGNTGLLSKIAIRKQESPKKKKKAKKTTKPIVEEQPSNDINKVEEGSIKFPHHKVDKIKGFETLQSKKVDTKETSSVKSVAESANAKPFKAKVEFTSVNFSPMGNPLSAKETPAEEMKQVHSNVEENEQSKKIEALLEKTASLDISKLMGESSIDSQINVIRNTSLDSKNKGDK